MKKSFIFIVMLFVVLGLAAGAAVTRAADSLTGNWNMSVDSSRGKGTSIFVLQQDGEEITGTYQGVSGKIKVTGKIQGSDFEYIFNYNGIDITYKGKVEGNKVSGLVEYKNSKSVVSDRAGRGTSTSTFTGEKR
ncbi:MAG: hypothetical protein ABSE95_17210 [Thermodesulfobacteriota bacterium]|jgi:hypothetical protein